MVSVGAFVTSLLTSALIFVILVLVFVYLSRRPGNKFVYYPALIASGRDPPDATKSRGPLTWISEAYSATEEDVVAVAGLDAAIYITLFSTALKIILYTSIFALPVLIPLAATDDNLAIQKRDPDNSSNTTKLDNISMANIQEKSSRIWAFFIGVYWLSFVCYWVLRETYKHVVALRAGAQGDTKAKPEQFSCLVRDIPPRSKNESRTEQVDAFFRRVHPDTYEKSLIVTKLKKVITVGTFLTSF